MTLMKTNVSNKTNNLEGNQPKTSATCTSSLDHRLLPHLTKVKGKHNNSVTDSNEQLEFSNNTVDPLSNTMKSNPQTTDAVIESHVIEKSIENHAHESSSIHENSTESTIMEDISFNSAENHEHESSATVDIDRNCQENTSVQASASVSDMDVYSEATNSLQIQRETDTVDTTVTGSVKPVCEDGELCVCENIAVGAKSQKRKSERQNVSQIKNKRQCTVKSGCEKVEPQSLKHIRRELKESYRTLRYRISKLNADSAVLEKLRTQVNDRRTCCRKENEKPSRNDAKTKKVFSKFTLPDFDSFGEDSITEVPYNENSFTTNDLNDTDTLFMSESFDTNLDKDDCEASDEDDDEDLPVGLTPIKIDKFFQEKDIVWVKWKGWPYLPAWVKRVYKKKKRMTCLVFAPEDKPEKPWSVSTAGGKVWSYFDNEKKEEIMKASETLEPLQKDYFKECMGRLEMFLTRKALRQIKDDYAYFNQDELSDTELTESGVEDTESLNTPDTLVTTDNSKTHDDEDEEAGETEKRYIIEDKLSKRGEKRKEKIRQKTQKFTDYLLSSTCKEYLQNVFLEKRKSERHKTFLTGTVKEKARLKHQGYGPIDDDNQIMSLLTTFASWLKEVNTNPCLNDNAYIMDVWAPEAIVFVYQKFFRYSKKRAWDMFYKGVRRTKEELKSEHAALMAHMRNMTPEEKQNMQERHEEMLRAAGIEPVRPDLNVKNLR